MTSTIAQCGVCRLEHNTDPTITHERGLQTRVFGCTHCRVEAHKHLLEQPLRIHSLGGKDFAHKSCWDIMHSPTGREIWVPNPPEAKTPYNLKTGHPVVQELRVLCGLSAVKSRKRKADDESQPLVEEEEDDDDFAAAREQELLQQALNHQAMSQELELDEDVILHRAPI